MATTVFDVTSAASGTDDGNGNGNTNFRQLFKTAALGSATGTQVRITVQFGTAEPNETPAVDSFYFGRHDTSSNTSYTGTQVQITFSGSGTLNGSAGTVFVSDWVTLGEAYSNSFPYIAAFHGHNGANFNTSFCSASNTDQWGNTGSDESSLTAPNQMFLFNSNMAGFVTKIEIQAAASGPSGSLAVTEATDTAAFSGSVVVSGPLATTEATDTATFNGSVVVSGPLATTEATDTAAFAGFVGTSGSLVTTEATDTASFSGSVVVSGTLATTEATDTAAFNGSVIVSGSLITTEATDTASFAGTVGNVVSGTLATTEAPDTPAFAGSVVVSGSLSVTESPDTATFSGSVIVSGSLITTETQDIAAFSGAVVSTITGTLVCTEAPDICLFLSDPQVGGKWPTGPKWHDPYAPKVQPTAPVNFTVAEAAAHLSKRGGEARAAALTAKQRSNIASIAAKARWK